MDADRTILQEQARQEALKRVAASLWAIRAKAQATPQKLDFKGLFNPPPAADITLATRG